MNKQTVQLVVPSHSIAMLSARLLGVVGIALASLIVLIVFILIGLIALAVAAQVGAGVFPVVILCTLLLSSFIALWTVAGRLRRQRGEEMLAYLEQAVRLNLPIPDFFEAMAANEGSGMARRSARIAQSLTEGASVAQSIAWYAPNISTQQVGLIWRGESLGRLREVLTRVLQCERRRNNEIHRISPSSTRTYALTVTTMLLALMAIASVLIAPQYRGIFEDFDTPLPWITRVTFELSQPLQILLLLAAATALLGSLGVGGYSLFFGTEGLTEPLRRRLEPLWWRLPIVSSAYRSRKLADACFLIQEAMRAGQSLPDAIDNAAHPLISPTMDKRLKLMAQGLRAGLPLSQAASQAAWPTLMVGMLGTATISENPADVFAYLQRYYETRTGYALVFLRAASMPLLTLLMAFMVGWFVLSLFYPLVVLIEYSSVISGY